MHRDLTQHCPLVDMLRQWQLDEHAVNLRVSVEHAHRIEDLLLSRVLRESDIDRVEAHLGACMP